MKAATGCLVGVLAIPVAALIVMAGLLTAAGAAPGGEGGGMRGVPPEFQPWIRKAVAECDHPELTPALMAAQLYHESGFRTDRGAVSHADAKGPAQFIPATWHTWGRDVDGKNGASEFDIGDAVMAQGRYMCSLLGDAKASPYRDDVRRLALAGYNAGWGAVERFKGVPPKGFARGETYRYVIAIMDLIDDFEGPSPCPSPAAERAPTPFDAPQPGSASRTHGAAAGPAAPAGASATGSTDTSSADVQPPAPKASTAPPWSSTRTGRASTSPAPPPPSTRPPPTGRSPAASCAPAICCSGPTAAPTSTTSASTPGTIRSCTHPAQAATSKSPH